MTRNALPYLLALALSLTFATRTSLGSGASITPLGPQILAIGQAAIDLPPVHDEWDRGDEMAADRSEESDADEVILSASAVFCLGPLPLPGALALRPAILAPSPPRAYVRLLC